MPKCVGCQDIYGLGRATAGRPDFLKSIAPRSAPDRDPRPGGSSVASHDGGGEADHRPSGIGSTFVLSSLHPRAFPRCGRPRLPADITPRYEADKGLISCTPLR
jgi:hypothetical protein